MPKPIQSIKFLDGSIYRVGQHVEVYCSTGGWQPGVIYAIEPQGRSKAIFVNMDCPEDLPSHMRWKLNPYAAAQLGYDYYEEPRDAGVAGGSLRHLVREAA